MPESASSLVILARPLLPLVKTVSSYCNRLHQERKVGKSLSEQSTDIADGILDQTLDRLRGGNIEDQWWKEILNRIGQEYITPDSLRSHIWQEWLAKTKVTEDLKLLAKAKIMDRDEDPEVRARLAKSYPDRTYEVHPMEFEPVDLVVAILVAGYLEPISHDQKVLLGTVQLLEANIVKHFDELGKKLSKTTSDSITQNAHTEHAKRELQKILTLAIFDPSRSRLDIQELVHRMFEGDLCLTSDSQKTEILVRCARLCAQDMETLALAKKIRDELNQTQSETDLSIVDALILQTEGQADKALQLIRDREDPDSRAVVFSILVRSRENQDALSWFGKQDGHGDTSFFTATGWINLAVSLAKAGRWDEAVKHLFALELFWEQSPTLALVEGHLNAAMLLPDGFRKTALDTIPLSKDISPILGSKAESYHDRAVTCFEFAEQSLKEIVGNEVMEFITDWKLWLRLMDPSGKDVQSAREEISRTMRDGKSAVGLMRFAWAFGIEFDEKPLREYLEERKQFGGLDNREILAEFFLSEQSLNPRDLFGYLEQHKEPLNKVFSSKSLTCMSVEALAKDGQTEKARRLLKDNKIDLGEVVSSRLTVLIDHVEGKDPRKKLEDSYDQTGESIDLQNLIAHLKEVGDREALLPLLRKLFEGEKNIENAKDLIICLGGHPFFDYKEIITTVPTFCAGCIVTT